MGGGGGRRNMKNSLCIPRLRANTNNNNNNSNSNTWLSPISLLERFREAVFRLIMLTALSKTARRARTNDVQQAYYPPDQHHNEAVADCIEFIKKSASNEESSRSSSDSIDSDSDCLGLPTLPVICDTC